MRRALWWSLALVVLLPAVSWAAVRGRTAVRSSTASAIHDPFTLLLRRYVAPVGVRYAAWKRSPAALRALSAYVDTLEAQDPSSWPPPRQLAYWIDLYNAATLELVLAHYPLRTIKDIEGPDGSPWKLKVVRVAGRDYSLDDIEKEVIREKFADPRAHFALNCAAKGCPPLAARAYVAERLDEQLEAATRHSLNDPRWVKIEAHHVAISRLFDWYREDFQKSAGTVIAFIARYHPGFEAETLVRNRIYLPYDWSLNEAR